MRLAGRLVTIRFTSPSGLLPGQKLSWQSPSGRLVVITVPKGSEPGHVLKFQVLASLLKPAAAP